MNRDELELAGRNEIHISMSFANRNMQIELYSSFTAVNYPSPTYRDWELSRKRSPENLGRSVGVVHYHNNKMKHGVWHLLAGRK
jgi:hypothetical protein